MMTLSLQLSLDVFGPTAQDCYSPFTKRWALALARSRIWRFSRCYRIQCSAAKFEIWKRVQKGYLNWGSKYFEPHNALLQVGSNGLDFDGFSQFSALGAKPGRNPILAMACFMEK